MDGKYLLSQFRSLRWPSETMQAVVRWWTCCCDWYDWIMLMQLMWRKWWCCCWRWEGAESKLTNSSTPIFQALSILSPANRCHKVFNQANDSNWVLQGWWIFCWSCVWCKSKNNRVCWVKEGGWMRCWREVQMRRQRRGERREERERGERREEREEKAYTVAVSIARKADPLWCLCWFGCLFVLVCLFVCWCWFGCLCDFWFLFDCLFDFLLFRFHISIQFNSIQFNSFSFCVSVYFGLFVNGFTPSLPSLPPSHSSSISQSITPSHLNHDFTQVTKQITVKWFNLFLVFYCCSIVSEARSELFAVGKRPTTTHNNT